MLRDIIVNTGTAAPATYKTSDACATGMGVIKDLTAGTVAFPSEETATDICLLQKSRIATGCLAARSEHSDYETEFNTFKKGELCVLYTYDIGESFATDQYTLEDGDEGKYVAVGTDGKWVVATVESKYKFVKFYNDAGHKLALIEVVETVGSNA